MTADEFYDWLDRVHMTRFTGCAGYFEKNDGAKQAWYTALRSYSVDSLTTASQQMFEDEKHSQAYPEKHPAILRGLAKGIAYDRGDRFPEGACCYCGKSGFVTVWLPPAVRCLTDQRLRKFSEWETGHWRVREQEKNGQIETVVTAEWCYHQLTVRCCCERGNAFGLSWCKYQLNPARHWRVFCPMDEGKSVIDSLVDRNNFLSAPKSEEFDAADYQFAN